ncbi:MAG: transcription termination factor NusA [Patescibacteria group bacterium]
MFDLKTMQTVLSQLEEEKGLSREVVLQAIEEALASAYKKEFGKRGQLIRAKFDIDTGAVEYSQIKIVVDPDKVIEIDEGEMMPDQEHIAEEDRKIRFNPEQHLYPQNARLIKTGAEVGEELVFPLEAQNEFSRVAAQTAKQVIMQKIRTAEKAYLSEQFGSRIGEIVSGTVERVERGSIFVNLDKAEGIISYHEQIKSERFKTGDRIRAYLFDVDDSGGRGIFLKLSRTHPEFLRKLFEQEVPELSAGTIEITRIAREPGFRSKVAVRATDEDIDPIGAMVGQNGSRVSTVTSELSGERIDIIEWSDNTEDFIESALSPARISDISVNEEESTARVDVIEDQYSLAIGRGGQNVRLAARLTGYKIDIIQVDAEGNEIITPEFEGDPAPIISSNDIAPQADTEAEQEQTDGLVVDLEDIPEEEKADKLTSVEVAPEESDQKDTSEEVDEEHTDAPKEVSDEDKDKS